MTGFKTHGDGVFYEQVKVSVLGFEHMTFRLRDFHSMTAPPSQQLRLSGSSMRHIEIRETLKTNLKTPLKIYKINTTSFLKM